MLSLHDRIIEHTSYDGQVNKLHKDLTTLQRDFFKAIDQINKKDKTTIEEIIFLLQDAIDWSSVPCLDVKITEETFRSLDMTMYLGFYCTDRGLSTLHWEKSKKGIGKCYVISTHALQGVQEIFFKKGETSELVAYIHKDSQNILLPPGTIFAHDRRQVLMYLAENSHLLSPYLKAIYDHGCSFKPKLKHLSTYPQFESTHVEVFPTTDFLYPCSGCFICGGKQKYYYVTYFGTKTAAQATACVKMIGHGAAYDDEAWWFKRRKTDKTASFMVGACFYHKEKLTNLVVEVYKGLPDAGLEGLINIGIIHNLRETARKEYKESKKVLKKGKKPICT